MLSNTFCIPGEGYGGRFQNTQPHSYLRTEAQSLRFGEEFHQPFFDQLSHLATVCLKKCGWPQKQPLHHTVLVVTKCYRYFSKPVYGSKCCLLGPPIRPPIEEGLKWRSCPIVWESLARTMEWLPQMASWRIFNFSKSKSALGVQLQAER